jgi:hypothetical protein
VVDIDNSETKKIVPTKAYLDEIIFVGITGFMKFAFDKVKYYKQIC